MPINSPTPADLLELKRHCCAARNAARLAKYRGVDSQARAIFKCVYTYERLIAQLEAELAAMVPPMPTLLSLIDTAPPMPDALEGSTKKLTRRTVRRIDRPMVTQ